MIFSILSEIYISGHQKVGQEQEEPKKKEEPKMVTPSTGHDIHHNHSEIIFDNHGLDHANDHD